MDVMQYGEAYLRKHLDKQVKNIWFTIIPKQVYLEKSIDVMNE